jgi:predicted phosphoribosyltransferase
MTDDTDTVRFKNRTEAARRLARALERFRGRRPLVLGIPRGGVVLADVIARHLDGDLDVALVRKLAAPGAPEFAIGSVTEQGLVILNEGWEEMATESVVRAEIEEALDLLRQRRAAITPHRAPILPTGRLALVVDDGIATGATMLAAIRSLKESGAERIVAAAAVAAPRAVETLSREVDEVVCLRTPEPFYAISLHFEEFDEVPDEEVARLLAGRPEAVPLHHGNFGFHPRRREP